MVGNYALFLSGTKTREEKAMNQKIVEKGEVHNRLSKNECPGCSKPLETKAKTETVLIRRCQTCHLTIHDNARTAECPENA